MGRNKKYENTHEVIVEVAERLFSQYGYERTTVDDIAKEAMLGKASVYKEFQSKEDIWVAVVIRHAQATNMEMSRLAALADTKKTKILPVVADVLMVQLLRIFDHVMHHMHGSQIVAGQGMGGLPPAIPPPNPKTMQKVLPYMQEADRIITGLLKKAVDNSEIPPESDCEQLTMFLRRGMAGYLPPHIMHFPKSRELFETEARQMIEILLGGIKAKSL